MSEFSLGLSEEDVRAFDREIGVEAALAINAVVTSVGESYTTLHSMHEAGELPSHIGGLLVRSETTAGDHIGRREENDTLFEGSRDVATERPPILEVYSRMGAEAQLPQSEIERRQTNIAAVNARIDTLAEPLITAVADKLPSNSTTRRFGRKPKDSTVKWTHQDGALQNHWGMTYTTQQNVPRITDFSCRTSATGEIFQSLAASVHMTQDNRAGEISFRWSPQHVGDTRAIKKIYAATGSSILEGYHDASFEQPGGMYVTTGDEPTLLIANHRGTSGNAYVETTRYRYDSARDTFVDDANKRPELSVDAVVTVAQKILEFMPTYEVKSA